MKMAIKAKYRNGILNTTCWKFFHTKDEMNEFFGKYPGCKYISMETGKAVEEEAERLGYNR